MGVIKEGILGGFSGKVGTVIGSTWRGIDYMRGQGSGSHSRTGSLKQDEQRSKFKVMVNFIRKVSTFVNVGYRRLAKHMTPLNAGLSYNLKNGIAGQYPDYEVAYDIVLLSRGDLLNAKNPKVEAIANSAIVFSWADNSGIGKARSTDICMVTAYCELQNLAISNDLSTAPTRQDEMLVLELSEFAGMEVETYITFVSADGLEIADSRYTGRIQLT